MKLIIDNGLESVKVNVDLVAGVLNIAVGKKSYNGPLPQKEMQQILFRVREISEEAISFSDPSPEDFINRLAVEHVEDTETLEKQAIALADLRAEIGDRTNAFNELHERLKLCEQDLVEARTKLKDSMAAAQVPSEPHNPSVHNERSDTEPPPPAPDTETSIAATL